MQWPDVGPSALPFAAALVAGAATMVVELAPTVGVKPRPQEMPAPAVTVESEVTYPVSLERAFALEVLAAGRALAERCADFEFRIVRRGWSLTRRVRKA